MASEEGSESAAPQLQARIGGLLYLVVIVGGVIGELFIREGVLIPGDAATSASRILASEATWRAGIALEYFMLLCSTALAVIFYVLLRPVNRDLALMAVLFNLVAITLEAANELNLAATLFPLAGAEYLRAFAPDQLHALAHLPTKSYAYGFGAGLLFFGVECLLLGYLIYRSGYLPRLIGVLMVLAGLGYLVNSFALILSPPLAVRLFPAILLPALVGESALCLWLLTRGVNAQKWRTVVART